MENIKLLFTISFYCASQFSNLPLVYNLLHIAPGIDKFNTFDSFKLFLKIMKPLKLNTFQKIIFAK